MNNTILIIEDEEILRFTFKSFLSKEGHKVITAQDYLSALKVISETDLNLIIADIVLGGKTGIDILRNVKKRGLKCPVVMITGQPSIETASESVRLGAYDYLLKPVQKNDLIKIASQALKYKSILDEKDQIEAEKEICRSDFETIFRSVQEGIITVDSQMKVTRANKAFEHICGLKPKEIIGKRFKDLSTQCRHSCSSLLEEVLQTQKEVKTKRVECIRHDKNKQMVIMTSSPLMNLDNSFAGAVLVVRDITRESDLERRLEPQRKFMNIIGKSQKMQEVY